MITRKHICWSLARVRQSRGIHGTVICLSANWNGKGPKPKNEKPPMDTWDKVNIDLKKRPMSMGSVGGFDSGKKDGKSIYSGERTPAGSSSEHMFPVHPVYPRIAEPLTDKQKTATKKERLERWTQGKKWMFIIGGIGLFLISLGYSVWFKLWKYYVPTPVYLEGKYADQLEIEHVVFLDVSVNGEKLGRIHIGLFHKDAPNWTENFHRLATGNTEQGISLVGTKFWKCNDRCLYGGDMKGMNGQHGLLAKGTEYLPEDKHNNQNIPFGVYAAGAFSFRLPDMNDSNFLILMDEGRVATFGAFTCVGMVLRGFNIVEMIANLPKQPYPYLLDCVEVTASGISPLSGDKERIRDILTRYHQGRLKRYISHHPLHKQDHEYYGEIAKKHIRQEEKREQVEVELEAARKEQEAKASSA